MTGGNGSVNGIIDTQSAVGGWPSLSSLPAPADNDNDGMPDDWEDAKGLNKDSPADAQLLTVDGRYPNVEVFLNSLVASMTENQLKDALTTSARELLKPVNQLRMYLDQNTGMLKFDPDQKIIRTEVFAATGILVKNLLSCESITEIFVHNLKSGIYFVRALDVHQNGYCGKFIIN
jgi:hypothetical protein